MITETICACDANSGKQCQFHARQPRPCPRCKEGSLQRYAGKDGYRVERVYNALRNNAGKVVGQLRNDPGRLVPVSGAFWACNRCEHCEKA